LVGQVPAGALSIFGMVSKIVPIRFGHMAGMEDVLFTILFCGE